MNTPTCNDETDIRLQIHQQMLAYLLAHVSNATSEPLSSIHQDFCERVLRIPLSEEQRQIALLELDSTHALANAIQGSYRNAGQ